MAPKTLEARVADLEARLTPAEPAPPHVPTVKEQRAELLTLIEGQKESVRIAEESQEWVDAIVQDLVAPIEHRASILEDALAALDALPAQARLKERDNAERRVKGATLDVRIATTEHQLAVDAAEAHRRVTVDSARARLAGYEADLAALD